LDFDGSETVLNIDGYNYMLLNGLARLSDIGVSYDVATNTVRLDKSKPSYAAIKSAILKGSELFWMFQAWNHRSENWWLNGLLRHGLLY